MSDTGVIESIDAEQAGSVLAADAAVSATTLTVDDATPFGVDGGTLTLDGTEITYTAADHDANTVTVPALAAAVPAGVPVLVPDVVTYWAQITPDDPDSLGVTVLVPPRVKANLPIEPEGTPVEYVVNDQGQREVVGPVGRVPTVQGPTVWNPHALRATNVVTPPGDYTPTTITSYTDIEVDGFEVTASELIVTEPGWYAVEGKVAWNSNASGKRAIAIYLDGVEIGRDGRSAEDDGRTYQTVTAQKRMTVGSKITMAYYQSSGAGLGFLFNENLSHLSVYRIST